MLLPPWRRVGSRIPAGAAVLTAEGGWEQRAQLLRHTQLHFFVYTIYPCAKLSLLSSHLHTFPHASIVNFTAETSTRGIEKTFLKSICGVSTQQALFFTPLHEKRRKDPKSRSRSHNQRTAASGLKAQAGPKPGCVVTTRPASQPAAPRRLFAPLGAQPPSFRPALQPQPGPAAPGRPRLASPPPPARGPGLSRAPAHVPRAKPSGAGSSRSSCPRHSPEQGGNRDVSGF